MILSSINMVRSNSVKSPSANSLLWDTLKAVTCTESA